MKRAVATAVAADAVGVTELLMALELSLYGRTTFSQADLEEEWSQLDVEQSVRVGRDGGRIVGYGVVRERGERWETAGHLGSERFDPTLWCVVRAGNEIAAGTVCAGGTYGGGWVHVLFTRGPWRKQGVGRALLADSFGRFWKRDEHSVGLGVDAANETGAFRLYERVGMKPVLGWVVYVKALGPAR